MKSVKIFLFFAFVGMSFAGNYFSSHQNSDPDQAYKINKEDECICRLGSPGRIISDIEAPEHYLPWQVSLANQTNSHFCGGSIINHYLILTSAYCVYDMKEEDIRVRVGLHSLNDKELDMKTYGVEKIIKYPGYINTKRLGGDIAILKLSRPIDKFIIGKVEPACFDIKLRDYPNGLMASGWGSTRVIKKNLKTGVVVQGPSQMSPVLKMAYFNEKRDKCLPFLICVNSNNGDSSCDGDAGGPLHHSEYGQMSVVGVDSFSNGVVGEDGTQTFCTGRDEAYTRLSAYKKWFKEEVGTDYCTAWR